MIQFLITAIFVAVLTYSLIQVVLGLSQIFLGLVKLIFGFTLYTTAIVMELVFLPFASISWALRGQTTRHPKRRESSTAQYPKLIADKIRFGNTTMLPRPILGHQALQ